MCEETSKQATIAEKQNLLNHKYLEEEIKRLTLPERPLDHYQILQKLGAGAFGQVFLARFQNSSEKVGVNAE